MFEIFIVIFCIAAVLGIRFYLFQMTLKKKMKYYSDPFQLADEVNEQRK
jgi:cytochrome c-type biogenesis protein CcmE